MKSGRQKHGKNWSGTGRYKQCDIFSKHFGNFCRDCKKYNDVRVHMKSVCILGIIWKGDCIQCIK